MVVLTAHEFEEVWNHIATIGIWLEEMRTLDGISRETVLHAETAVSDAMRVLRMRRIMQAYRDLAGQPLPESAPRT